MWREMATALRSMTKVILGETNSRVLNLKQSCWWNEEVQLKTKNKKTCYKAIYQCNNEENLKNYKVKNATKIAISEVWSKAYENLYK